MHDSPYFYPGISFYQPRSIRRSRLAPSQHHPKYATFVKEPTVNESRARVLQPGRTYAARLELPEVRTSGFSNSAHIGTRNYPLNVPASVRREQASELLALAAHLDTLEAQRIREERDRERSSLIEEFVSRGFNRTHAILAAGALIPVEPGQA